MGLIEHVFERNAGVPFFGICETPILMSVVQILIIKSRIDLLDRLFVEIGLNFESCLHDILADDDFMDGENYDHKEKFISRENLIKVIEFSIKHDFDPKYFEKYLEPHQIEWFCDLVIHLTITNNQINFLDQVIARHQLNVDRSTISTILYNAAYVGNLDIFKWVEKNGCELVITRKIIGAAARHGTEILKWLSARVSLTHPPFTAEYSWTRDLGFRTISVSENQEENLYPVASVFCEKGHIDNLQWAYSKFYSETNELKSRFILEILDKVTQYTYTEHDNLKSVLDWLFQNFGENLIFRRENVMRDYFMEALKNNRTGTVTLFLDKKLVPLNIVIFYNFFNICKANVQRMYQICVGFQSASVYRYSTDTKFIFEQFRNFCLIVKDRGCKVNRKSCFGKKSYRNFCHALKNYPELLPSFKELNFRN